MMSDMQLNVAVGKGRQMENIVQRESMEKNTWMEKKTYSEETAGEADDYLLAQIDEFRVKAQQLQQLLLTKESKVKELQVIVDEREDKAEELRKILEERQEKADGITAVVSKQIDALIVKVTAKLQEVENSVGQQLGADRKESDARMEQAKASLGQILQQLDLLKADLGAKVHSESVKNYRNVSELINNIDSRLDELERFQDIERKLVGVQVWSIVAASFGIVNFVGIVIMILRMLEVI